ncbi:Type III restriction enzyme, res subunit [compost metagenome]
MELREFQLTAVKELFEAMDKSAQEIILKSPTGSGKTIILTYFMQQYMLSYPNTVFIWLTPGKGSLEEQSKAKMDRYIHMSQTKLLPDVMTSGFDENDSCFINWEKLNKKGNNALKESERTNFIEHINRALQNGLRFVIVVDESHQNNTVKAEEIIQYFHTKKIIRCSATPRGIAGAEIIDIPEEEVIVAGLIKKMLVINENFEQVIQTENQINYLLERACAKHREIRSALLQNDIQVNPLIIIQLPNNSDLLQTTVEQWFEKKGWTYENGQLAVWLSNQHENLEKIEELDSLASAIIIKQAVATGWDCPRAQILVKLRDNMDETFEIQTIGRIRRMAEAKHYEIELLDSCYLYTFDEKFTEGVKLSMGKGALDASTLFLKKDYVNISLTSEHRTMVTDHRDPQKALLAIAKYFEHTIKTGTNRTENTLLLRTAGFVISDDIYRHTYSGETATINKAAVSDMNKIAVTEKLNTHTHGREYHQKIGKLGMEIGMGYSYMNTIIRRLFEKNSNYNRKILNLDLKQVYSFVINNTERLRHIIREAMAMEIAQMQLQFDANQVSKNIFKIPQTCLFTYDKLSKGQIEMKKNVYSGYLSSAEPRSSGERIFEKFCEQVSSIEWIYKNGDKGSEYLSIVYNDNSGKQRNFFPDYIICVQSEIWIIETKGGFDRKGNSQDIDIFSPKKFEVLKNYLERYNLKGGFVRYDNKSNELCICTEKYSDNVDSSEWQLLSNVIL